MSVVTWMEVHNPGWRPRVIRFGAPFCQGDMPKPVNLILRTRFGFALKSQIASASSWPDGSVRMAVVDVKLPWFFWPRRKIYLCREP